jgi:actin-like ATPase involved in cell morphogenesis
LLIGERTAEQIKIEICSYPFVNEHEMNMESKGAILSVHSEDPGDIFEGYT